MRLARDPRDPITRAVSQHPDGPKSLGFQAETPD